MNPGINRIVLPGGLSEGPAIPESFVQSLRQYDSTLIVAWNTRRKRFVIEQCIEHLSGTPEHTHVCRRSYVLMAQDDEGTMLPLGDRVLEMVKAADVSRLGYGPGDLERFNRDKQAELDAHRAELEAKQDDLIHHATRENRRQLNKAVHLIQQHDLTVNQ